MSHTQHPLTVEIHVPNAEALHELSIFLAGFFAKHHGAPHHGTFAAETAAPVHQHVPAHHQPHPQHMGNGSHAGAVPQVEHAPQYLQPAQPLVQAAAAPVYQMHPSNGVQQQQTVQSAPVQHAPQNAPQPSISFQDLMTLQSQLIEARCIDPAGILRIYGEYGYSAAQRPQPHHFGAIYEKLAAHRRPQ